MDAVGHRLLAGVLLLAFASPAFAQTPTAVERDLPIPGDVESIDAIIGAVYDVISGPSDQERDWDRFRSLFAPNARLIPTRYDAQAGSSQAIVFTIDEYIERAASFFKQPGGFFENEIGRTTEVYGSIAHAFSSYESLREGETEPFMRGINSFQLLNDGEKWRIVSVFWEAERPDNPIPGKYLFD